MLETKSYNFCLNFLRGELWIVKVWTYDLTSIIYNSPRDKLWQKLWDFLYL